MHPSMVRPARSRPSTPWALVASVVVHGGLVGLARPAPPPAAPVAAVASDDPVDRWTGSTLLPSAALVDVTVDVDPGRSLGAPAAAAATNEPTRAPPSPGLTIPSKPPEPEAASRPTSERPAAKRSTPKPPTKEPSTERAGERSEGEAGAASAAATAPRSLAPRPPQGQRTTAGRSAATPPVAEATRGAGSGSGDYGADGPGRARDMGRAFTRAIPAACQADPSWQTLPLGDAGTLEVTVEVDAEGKIAGFRPSDRDPPEALVRVVKRTVALLGAGTFALRHGTVGAGSQVLALSVRITPAPAASGDDEATPSKTQLEFTYDGGRGKAAFTTEGGRRVEVTLRVVRVSVAG